MIKVKSMDNDSGDKILRLPPQSYLKENDNQKYKLTMVSNPTSFGSKAQERYWVMGAQFFHYYYSIYDFNNMKVGLIEAKE